MSAFAVPTREDQINFLLRLYFGAGKDPLNACVQRAYRDLNRTLHGVSRLAEGVELRERASLLLCSGLTSIADSGTVLAQEAFDAWHCESCKQLEGVYAEYGYKFYVGQAQKWINMAFKYVHVFGEGQLPGFKRLYAYGHVPLDNIMIIQLRNYEAPVLSKPWSRLCNYSEYMDFQNWFRGRFPGSAPLSVEFRLWQAPAV